VVDALIKRVHKMNNTTISMCMKDLKDKILESIETDQHYAQVKEILL
jgi:hypothetical protein